MIAVQISFQLSPQELTLARNLYYSRVHSRMVRAIPWLAISCGLLVTIPVLVKMYRRPDTSHSVGITAVCIFTAYGFMTRRRLHEFASEPGYRDAQIIELSAEGIDFPELRNLIPWTKISRFVENDEMFLLISPWPFRANARASLQSKPVVIVVPKRVLAQADIEAVRTLAREQLSFWAQNASTSDFPPTSVGSTNSH